MEKARFRFVQASQDEHSKPNGTSMTLKVAGLPPSMKKRLTWRWISKLKYTVLYITVSLSAVWPDLNNYMNHDLRGVNCGWQWFDLISYRQQTKNGTGMNHPKLVANHQEGKLRTAQPECQCTTVQSMHRRVPSLKIMCTLKSHKIKLVPISFLWVTFEGKWRKCRLWGIWAENQREGETDCRGPVVEIRSVTISRKLD